MGKLRIQNAAHQDVVVMDFSSGEVDILLPKELGDAARAWWDAVDTLRAVHSEATDVILRDAQGPHGGDLIFTLGSGSPQGKGGDITVFLKERASSQAADPGSQSSVGWECPKGHGCSDQACRKGCKQEFHEARSLLANKAEAWALAHQEHAEAFRFIDNEISRSSEAVAQVFRAFSYHIKNQWDFKKPSTFRAVSPRTKG